MSSSDEYIGIFYCDVRPRHPLATVHFRLPKAAFAVTHKKCDDVVGLLNDLANPTGDASSCQLCSVNGDQAGAKRSPFKPQELRVMVWIPVHGSRAYEIERMSNPDTTRGPPFLGDFKWALMRSMKDLISVHTALQEALNVRDCRLLSHHNHVIALLDDR